MQIASDTLSYVQTAQGTGPASYLNCVLSKEFVLLTCNRQSWLALIWEVLRSSQIFLRRSFKERSLSWRSHDKKVHWMTESWGKGRGSWGEVQIPSDRKCVTKYSAKLFSLEYYKLCTEKAVKATTLFLIAQPCQSCISCTRHTGLRTSKQGADLSPKFFEDVDLVLKTSLYFLLHSSHRRPCLSCAQTLNLV